jgi:hypothetical protein
LTDSTKYVNAAQTSDMTDAPFGFRRPEDAPLFRQTSTDPLIIPDRVSPAIEGYFRIPAVWIGDPPDPATVEVLNPAVHHAVVIRKSLDCGIDVRVQRDGTFLFDCSSWQLAPTVEIPGYRAPEQAHRALPEHTRMEEVASGNSIVRARMMNVHQACLTTSEIIVRGGSRPMGLPITPLSTLKAITFDVAHGYPDAVDNVYTLARNVLNNKDEITRKRPLGRRNIDTEVVEHSLNLLDQILIKNDAILLQMVESAFVAACRQGEGRSGEAVILAWGVCEQLVVSAWTALLADAKANGDGVGRFSRERMNKLTGRDYTASVMVEMLELAGRIDHDLYRVLEVARKARNKWVHELQSPKESEARMCIKAVERLLFELKGVRMALLVEGSRGVPQWNVWIWERIKSRGGL